MRLKRIVPSVVDGEWGDLNCRVRHRRPVLSRRPVVTTVTLRESREVSTFLPRLYDDGCLDYKDRITVVFYRFPHPSP